MDVGAIGAIVNAGSALASTGVGIYNSIQNNKMNKKNFDLQQENYEWQKQLGQQTLDWNKDMANRDFDYNKRLQEQIFQREDSAVQRMVADNRAAGLSPIAGLAGASAGQALEANTGYVSAPQTLSAPQMSANQLLTDFSSLGQLGVNLENYQHNKDALKLQSEKLDLDKSSNEANLKQMQANLESTQMKNEIARATLQDEIEGKKLSNQNVKTVIQKNMADILNKALEHDIKELDKVQTMRDMQEWLENKDLRMELGNVSLEEAKAKVLAMQMLNNHNSEAYGTQLDILREELKSIQKDNQSLDSLYDDLKALGMSDEWAKRVGAVGDIIMRGVGAASGITGVGSSLKSIFGKSDSKGRRR